MVTLVTVDFRGRAVAQWGARMARVTRCRMPLRDALLYLAVARRRRDPGNPIVSGIVRDGP